MVSFRVFLGLGLGLVSANGVGQKQVFQSLVWFPEPEIRKIEGAGNHTSDWKICYRPDPLTKNQTPKTEHFYNVASKPNNV